MDIAGLRVFESVARLGAMNRAAEALHTVQSNVTTRIRLLEEDLGERLFERHSRGVTLTAAGVRLLPYALAAARLIDDARRAVVDDGEAKGRLTIGSLETTAALRLSPMLADYAASHPAVDLVLRTGTTAEMIEAILDHQLEAAFVCGPVAHPDLAVEVAFFEELVLVTAPGDGALDRILTAPRTKIVVLRAGCSYRQRLENILARRGVVGLRQLEFGSIDALVSCVAAGIGVTLLPRGIVQSAAAAGRVGVHDLPASEARVETLLVRRRDGYVSSALTALLDAVGASPEIAAVAAE